VQARRHRRYDVVVSNPRYVPTPPGFEESIASLESTGPSAAVVAQQRIPFGPVLMARSGWLKRTGQKFAHEEVLVVIRADKPYQT
jgi:methylase of polypeptide subunit release factors